MTGKVWPRQRQNRQCEHQQLKNEQPVVTEALKRRACLRLREKFLPEQRAGHKPHHPLAFEQIKQDHHRNRGGKKESCGRQESHPHTSASRSCFSSSSSSGVSEAAMKKFMPREEQYSRSR